MPVWISRSSSVLAIVRDQPEWGCCGSITTAQRRRRSRSAAVAIGLPFLGLGVVLAQMYAADCLRDSETAGNALARLLALDPREPQAVLLAAVMACEAGDVPRAMAILYADPHPSLRRRLAAHLDDLSTTGGGATRSGRSGSGC
jgi:hypothetical protein